MRGKKTKRKKKKKGSAYTLHFTTVILFSKKQNSGEVLDWLHDSETAW